MATFQIPSSLAKFTEQRRQVMIEATTFQDALRILCDKYPQLQRYLIDEKGELLLHVAVFIDDEQLEADMQQPITIQADSQIALVLALSGG